MTQQTQQAPPATGVAAPVKTKVDALKSMISASSVQEQFKNALDKNSGPFVASLIDLYSSDTKLQECDPKNVIMEALKAAVLKLPINKALGFAYILQFNNSVKQSDGSWTKVATPTFVIGYKGLIQLAMRTGQYKYLNADVVYEGELIGKDKLTGAINLNGDAISDKVIGYFCHFELINGFSKTLFVEVEKMAAYAKKYAPSIKAEKAVKIETLVELANTPEETGKVGWLGGFTSMALKTVTRNLLSKYGYLSIEMQQAIIEDKDYDYEEIKRNEVVRASASKQINAHAIEYGGAMTEIPEETKEVSPESIEPNYGE